MNTFVSPLAVAANPADAPSHNLAVNRLYGSRSSPRPTTWLGRSVVTYPCSSPLRALALALNVSADSLLFDDEERGPQNPTLRLKLEAVDQFTPDEQEHVAAFIEGALLRHHARQAFSGHAS